MEYTIKNIHKLLKEKKITPSKLIEDIYKKLENFKNINSFITVTKELAIKSAKLLDKLPFEDNNLLFGIPYGAKDNFVTKDILTTAGSKILSNLIPPYDSTLIKDLNNKKTIMLGKTTMDELGMGWSGLTSYSGKVLNPWNNEYITGGSSSGSAALVATGIVPFALGTDTGDSIRKPASYCGIVGFKPTYGTLSRVGVIPYAPSLDTVGFFTRNVEDSSILYEHLLKYDENDYTIKKHNYKHSLIKNNFKEFKAAYISEIHNKTIPEVKAEMEKIFDELRKIGIKVSPVHFDINLLNLLTPIYYIITCVEAISSQACLTGQLFGNRLQANDWKESAIKTRSKNLGKIIQFRYMIGAYSSSENNQEEIFLFAKKIRRLIVKELNKIYKNFDFLIGPCANDYTKKIKDVNPNIISLSEDIVETFLMLSNFNGSPSITLPLSFFKKDKMPFGININANLFEEGKLFSLATKIEDITGLKNLRPGDIKDD